MRRIIAAILTVIMILMPLSSLGATGHAEGCPNTGYDTSCCTKTFLIGSKEGYRVVDVIINGVSHGPITSYTFTTSTAPQVLKVITEPIAETYTITYDANGGSGAPDSQTKVEGITLVLSSIVPIRNGFTFLGWATSNTATAAEYEAGGTYTADASTTLYAVWDEVETYTVTFNANGGTGTMSPQTFTEGVAQNLTTNTFTKDGFTFAGWSTTAGGSKELDNGQSYTAAGNVTLYAVWATITYTITYDANGGTGAPTAQTKVHGTDLTLSSTVPTKDGFTFLGWSTSNTATSAQYASGGTYTTNANATLYAVWEEVQVVTIDNLPIGTYIQYNPSNTTVTVLGEDDFENSHDQIYYPQTYTEGWKVFSNNGNGQIDIISAENVLTNSSGTETTLALEGLVGYANIVDILNTLSEGYINPDVAYAGRSLGSKKGSSRERIDFDTCTWDHLFTNGIDGFPYTDTLYTNDQTIINTAIDGAYPLRTSSAIWLASRELYTDESYSDFCVRHLYSNGNIGSERLYESYSDGSSYRNNVPFGVRPIISLKAGMVITGGSGTKEDPYVLTHQPQTVNDLPLGSYIQYNPSNTTITMLSEDTGYDSDQTYYPQTYTQGWKLFKNTNGQIDIISAENVLTNSSGTKTTLTLKGLAGYANVVDTLNTISEAYINPTYATAGRSIGAVKGSSQERVDPDTCTFTHTVTNGNNGFPYDDTLYTDDRTIINTAVDGAYPLRHSSGYTWLASRILLTNSGNPNFYVRYLNTSGGFRSSNLYYSYSDGSSGTGSDSYGVRPVIHLKAGLAVVGGTGTQGDPYILGDSQNTTYTVTYDANGGSGTMAPQTFTEGVAQNLTANTFTKAGHTFAGWATTSGGTVAYADGASYTATANATLYAVWTPKTYTVTFDANGGSGAPAAQTKTHGTDLTLSSTIPIRSGFTFLGWATSNTATSEEYAAGGTYTTDASTTLYAVWEVALPSIDEIPLGSYIQYTPSNTSVTVLGEDSGHTSDQTYYPQTYTNGWKLFANNGNGQIDIISAENVLTNSSGTETTLTLKGQAGYANAVDTLNTLSEGYINPEVAYAGRSIGGVKGSSTERIEINKCKHSSLSSTSSKKEPYTDSASLYEVDTTIINTNVNGVYPLRHTGSTNIWLASRTAAYSSSYVDFKIKHTFSSGGWGQGTYFTSDSDGSNSSYSHEYGVRPVISLKAGMEITGGSGTKEDPYILTNVTKTVNDLTIGGYIQYSPSNTSITILKNDSGYTGNQTYYPTKYTKGWKVFKNTNGQIDIISAENVLTNSSGTETTLGLRNLAGYANGIDTLNTLSEAYINPTYATAGRCIGAVKGSSQERIDPDTCTFTHTVTNGNNGFPYNDELYTADLAIINTAVYGAYPLRHTSSSTATEMWLASRHLVAGSSLSRYDLIGLDRMGSTSNTGKSLYYSRSDSSTDAYSRTHGVRPVISLKSGLTFTGSGTEDDPYVIVN